MSLINLTAQWMHLNEHRYCRSVCSFSFFSDIELQCFTNVQVSAHSVGGAREYVHIYHSSRSSNKYTCLLLLIREYLFVWSFPIFFVFFCFSHDRNDMHHLLNFHPPYSTCVLSFFLHVKLVHTRATWGYTWSTTCVHPRLLLWSQSWESHLSFS